MLPSVPSSPARSRERRVKKQPALTLVDSRALPPGFEKSRSLTERSRMAAVPRGRRTSSSDSGSPAARTSRQGTLGGSPRSGSAAPDSDNCPLLRCEGEGDARRPRLALTQLQPPVRSWLSEGSSSPFSLRSRWQPKAQQRFAKVRSGPLVPGLLGQESCWPA